MFYTYIIYNVQKEKYNVGVTVNLQRRKKILCHRLPGCKIVWYEEFDNSSEATRRENELLSLPKELLKELVLETNPMLVEII